MTTYQHGAPPPTHTGNAFYNPHQPSAPGFAYPPHEGAYPGPPPTMSTHQAQPPHVVVVEHSAGHQATTVTTDLHNLPKNSTRVTCPSCHQQIKTRVDHQSNTRTHLFALLCCFFCLCCVPYLLSSCKSSNHYCPRCGAFIGQGLNM